MLQVVEAVLFDDVRRRERAEHLAEYRQHGRRTRPGADHCVRHLYKKSLLYINTNLSSSITNKTF